MKPYIRDADLELYCGDAVAVLRELPPRAAQTCVTSPPYWQLRDYGDERQLGLEPSPELYAAALVRVFAEVWRVLRDDGTLWLVIGDSYSGDGGRAPSGGGHAGLPAAADRMDGARRRELDRAEYPRPRPVLRPKDMVGIPWRVAFALQAAGWLLRCDVIWSKPNPMPESTRDRPTKSHEYVFLLAKRERYFYDADAVAEPLAGPLHHPGNRPRDTRFGQDFGDGRESAVWGRPSGRNRRSVWTVTNEPLPDAHFATYPQALVEPCILAGTSEAGECSACGAAWRRVVELVGGQTTGRSPANALAAKERGIISSGVTYSPTSLAPYVSEHRTVGFEPACRCDAPSRPQTVLDPFVGSGTTSIVARRHGRRSLGIDLSERYLRIARDRTAQQTLFAAGRERDAAGQPAPANDDEPAELRLDV